ncbi:MAG: hypothetical protein B9J98_06265 [Candidatus Terraquivivens tikiterensis]|uniref:Alpha-galactosidase NEW3 domain-containing protein n=1 Tax=Candidatus Terraquivivens tikiterensis TaxID=1980982 RepID=A0A2R7Y1Y1_9ARCH|nr:MAG: hypothetical protein B9J98_06265 [Candidatus Terraquivivens tikiterensis]
MKAHRVLFAVLSVTFVLAMVNLASAHSENIIAVDAFWGDVGNKIEVDAGDKNLPLVLQMVNARKEQIIGVRGYLVLPEGFEDSLTKSRFTREAVYADPVPSGRSFTLRYLLDTSEQLKPGLYKAYAVVYYKYYDEDEKDMVSSSSYVYFDIRITGKSLISVKTEPSSLVPGMLNEAKIVILNDGTADVQGVTVTLGDPDIPGVTIVKTQRTWQLSRISPGTDVVLPISLQVEGSVANRALRIPVDITYLDSYGQQKRFQQNAMFRIGTQISERIRIEAMLEDDLLSPTTVNRLRLIVRNEGNEAAYSVDVELTLPQSEPAFLTFVGRPGRWSLETLGPGEERPLDFELFTSQSASGKSFLLSLRASYRDRYNNSYEVLRTLGVRVADQPLSKAFKISSEAYLTSGSINSLSIRIKNLKQEVLKDLSITLEPTASWVTILEGAREYYKEIRPEEELVLSVSAFVSEQTLEKTSTVGYSTYINVNVEYTDSHGITKTESYRLGYYVRGIIDLKLQELSFEVINKQPYLVGRLLNEGNEPAYFTRVFLADANDVIRPIRPVYLGDVNPNAPLMFNLPVAVVGNLTPGIMRVKILVEYKDTLRDNFSKSFVYDVMLTSGWPQTQEKTGISQADRITVYLAATLIGVAIVVSVVSVAKIRGRKRRDLSIQSGTPSAA